MPTYPLIASRTSPAVLAQLTEEYRVGKFVARASSKDSFDHFVATVLAVAEKELVSPPRILTLPHLCAAIASKLPLLPEETGPLIEGLLLEFIADGRLRRISTVNRHYRHFHGIYSSACADLVEEATQAIKHELSEQAEVSLDRAEAIIPVVLRGHQHTASILCGALLYLGYATTMSEGGARLTTLQLPYAHRRA